VLIGALVALLAAGLAACTGAEGPSTDTTAGTGTTIDDPTRAAALEYPAYRDPGQPIYVALSRRFALLVDSEPSQGFSWQVTNEPDPAVVVPLGTQFRTESPGVQDAPSGQYISFAASGEGTTTIELRYVTPSGEAVPDTLPLVFTVIVTFTGEPPPPEEGTTLPSD
jgi:hypothetical protein